MVQERNTTEARQGEQSKRTFVVLAISITLAAVLAVAAYIFVFATPNAQLPGSLPSAGSATQNPETNADPTETTGGTPATAPAQ